MIGSPNGYIRNGGRIATGIIENACSYPSLSIREQSPNTYPAVMIVPQNCGEEKRLHFQLIARLKTAEFLEFLKAIVSKYRKLQRLIIVLDNA